MKKYKITHLTSVHKRYDTRIFLKECSSLVKNNNYNVSLVVADGKGNETKNGISIYDVGNPNKKFDRIINTTKKVFEKAMELNSDIYHLHDPELILIGLKLKKMGKKVIMDMHEDVPKQLLSKSYLNKYVGMILSKSFQLIETYACKKFDYVVTATPFIKTKFLQINVNTEDINNFPIIDELSYDIQWNIKKDEVCYIGNITKVRGIKELVKAMKSNENIKLNLGGTFDSTQLEQEVKQYPEWQNVKELGYLNREEILEVFKNSKAGLVTLYPIINYLDALPVKMFEYMLAGIPVIASDIPFWKNIIKENNCGLCVNPYDSNQIADAIKYIIENPIEAEKMGRNGRNAVLKKYNWAEEEKKLFKLYKRLEK